MDSQTEVLRAEVGQGSGLTAARVVCKANTPSLYKEGESMEVLMSMCA